MNDSNTPTTGKQPTPKWFRILLAVAIAGVAFGIYGTFLPGGMVDVVKDHLEMLRENRITQAYYDYTSKKFQETTSLEQFREFIALYPVLAENKGFRLEGRKVEDDVGTVNGVLFSNQYHEMKADFHLIKEGRHWKILSIRLKEPLQENKVDSATQEVADKVHEHLKTLQKEDIIDAYYGFVAKDFQRETSINAFRDYVAANPVLKSFKNIEFKERRIEDGTGVVNLILSADSGDYLLEYKLKRENGDWKIWSLRVELPIEVAAKKAATNPDSLVTPVREFLDALLLDNLEQAYFDTAKEFQDTTPYASFETFVESNPVLSHRDLADFKTRLIENGVGKLRVNLHDDTGMTVLEFKLGFDEGEWKIWGVRFVEKPEETSRHVDNGKDHQSAAKEMIDVINRQLLTLRHQNLEEAYERYYSATYKYRHPFTNFEESLSHYPCFTNCWNARFDNPDQISEKNTATLKGTVTTLEHKNVPVQYTMVLEDRQWKIEDFTLLAENDTPKDLPDEPLESEDIIVPYTDIKKINVGVDVDSSGVIKTPRVTIDPDTDLLYFNVHIEKGVADNLVTLLLSHIDSETTAPHLSTKLVKSGPAIIVFSYASPKKGWPVGEYLVKVTTSTGDEHIQRFIMREGEKKYY